MRFSRFDKHNQLRFQRGSMYLCDLCNKTFTRKDSLLRHIKYVEQPNITLYKCSSCIKSFKYKQDLKRHFTYCHLSVKPTHVCHICGKTYKYKFNLKRHFHHSHTNKVSYVADSKCLPTLIEPIPTGTSITNQAEDWDSHCTEPPFLLKQVSPEENEWCRHI